MRKYSPIISAWLLMVTTTIQATSVSIKETNEDTCGCVGTFTRISFVVSNELLTDIEVVDSSSNDNCDKWHIKTLTSTTAIHPDGVTGIGVVGNTAKDKIMNYDICLMMYEIEVDTYWIVEELLIDLKKINRK